MHGTTTYLLLGPAEQGVYLNSLKNSSLEISSLRLSFAQGTDERGNPSTQVHRGILQFSMPGLLCDTLAQWAMQYKHYDGKIVTLDIHDIPIERIIFTHAACVDMALSYEKNGTSYFRTSFTISTETLLLEGGISFENNRIH